MNKVAIYVRVSTEDQTTEQQENPLKERCNQAGIPFEIFKEIGVSGSKESRPVLDRMMQEIRAGNFNIVMVSKLDRLGRSLKHLLNLIEEFNNKKIKFVCLSPDIDTTTSQGRFFLQIMGAVAEFERALIIDRVKEKIAVCSEKLDKDGSYINQQGKKITSLGRPKGAKDKGQRKKGGYYDRYKKVPLSKIQV